jgi:hypothetical protein
VAIVIGDVFSLLVADSAILNALRSMYFVGCLRTCTFKKKAGQPEWEYAASKIWLAQKTLVFSKIHGSGHNYKINACREKFICQAVLF